MRLNRSLLGPALVLGIAVLTGGWFFQQGTERGAPGFLRGRLFDQVADLVSQNYVEDVDQEELYNAAIEGMLERLGDPNTAFLQHDDYRNFAIRTEGNYGGVGLEVVEREGYVTVVTAMPGTPAQRAGIRAGDLIVAVDSERVVGEGSSDKAVDRLRGRPGTEVQIGVQRPGVESELEFLVTRERIEVKSVPFHAMLGEDIGYVPLQIFSETSTDEVGAAIDSLRAEGARGVVLDLRGNPGGVLDAGIGISELFLDAGADIVETRGRAEMQSETYRATRAQRYPGFPLVVLVDERSASASEIVAGALQDHDRALLIGHRTFGKGSVQTLYPLAGGDVLKLTTARWYTPVGRSIQKDRSEQVAELSSGALSPFGQLVPRDGEVDLPTVRSVGGRTLVGGGGITPDLTVLPDTLPTEAQQAVFELYKSGGALNRSIFDFVISTLADRGESAGPPVQVTDALMADLRRVLEAAGVEADDAVWRAATPFLRNTLRTELALQASGEKAQFLVQAEADRALMRAVEALRSAGTDAGALVRVAQGGEGAL
ncbi:MAG: S41 family peptidase [Gemmatimonadota bacterium]